MTSVLSRRGLAVAAVTPLLALTVACGGSVENLALCTEATKAMSDFSADLSKTATDPDGLSKATAELTGKLKEIAGRADGDLAKALNDYAASMSSNDPQVIGAAAGDGATAIGDACAQ